MEKSDKGIRPMFNKFTDNTNGGAHTLVSRTTEVVGDIHFNGELIIEGRVIGKIYADDDSSAVIRVAEKGVVEGEISVPTAIINGLVQGDVRSGTHVELSAKAVVLGNVYGIPSLVVDTHVTRISNLLKFVNTKDAVKIEKELCKIIDKDDWTLFAHLLIDHGRLVCVANRPKCGECIISELCPSNKGDH